MKKLIIILVQVFLSSCVTQSIKQETLQKVAKDMSLADVVATLGIPNEKKQANKTQVLIYNGYELNFVADKLNTIRNTSNPETTNVDLKPVAELFPNYTPDSLVLNKDLDLEFSAYQVAGYLKNETLFLQAVQVPIRRNGYTITTNAMCVAITAGFSRGVEAVIRAGYNEDLRLRNDKGNYVFPRECVNYQKDPELAQKYKNLLVAKNIAPLATEAIQVATDGEKNKINNEKLGDAEEKSQDKSNYLIDWEEFKEFMKPQLPPTPSRVQRR